MAGLPSGLQAQDSLISSGNGTFLADASAVTDPYSGNVFRPTNVPGQVSNLVFIIRNTAGTGQLNLGAVTVTGTHAADIAITQPSSSAIPPGCRALFHCHI